MSLDEFQDKKQVKFHEISESIYEDSGDSLVSPDKIFRNLIIYEPVESSSDTE